MHPLPCWINSIEHLSSQLDSSLGSLLQVQQQPDFRHLKVFLRIFTRQIGSDSHRPTDIEQGKSIAVVPGTEAVPRTNHTAVCWSFLIFPPIQTQNNTGCLTGHQGKYEDCDPDHRAAYRMSIGEHRREGGGIFPLRKEKVIWKEGTGARRNLNCDLVRFLLKQLSYVYWDSPESSCFCGLPSIMEVMIIPCSLTGKYSPASKAAAKQIIQCKHRHILHPFHRAIHQVGSNPWNDQKKLKISGKGGS